MLRLARGFAFVYCAAAAFNEQSCTGQSSNLTNAECQSWLSLYDAIVPEQVDNSKSLAFPPGPPQGPSRLDPCSVIKFVQCSADGKHIVGIDLGGRSLTGTLPTADKLSGLAHLSYLMLAFNNLTGAVPALDFPSITGCNYGLEKSCCWLSSTVSNVYDEDVDSGVTNQFACPLPPGAAEHCHAVCTDNEGIQHGYGFDVPLRGNQGSRSSDTMPRVRKVTPGYKSKACQQCVPASPKAFPQCDVHKSLLWHHGHISAAYCTDRDLVVFSDAVPNHAVRLEEMPKPPGSGPETGDFSVRIWNSQSYAYRIPLRPKYLPDTIVNYTGAGALAMTLNGVSMYPIMSPGVAAIDPDRKWQEGHDRDKNMKLDGQLDRCNEHAGRGFDIHYHGNPSCMYNDSHSGHSPIIGWAADGFPLYGKFNSSHMEPDDLDRCNGHFEDSDGDGHAEYHYHVSPRYPYTIACWHGDTSNMSYEDGGQPGQDQWAFDNARTRAEKDRQLLLPCCESEVTDAIPDWFSELSPYSPVDHDNVRVHTAAARLAMSAPKINWMYARHGDWGTDEVARPTQSTENSTTSSAFACTGKSANLSAVDCRAWQDLFDATGGTTSWIGCKTLRSDPCSCVAANGEVACGFIADDAGSQPALRVVALGLQVNGLSGSLPRSLANMTALTDLQLEGNHVGLPGSSGLGGLLPPLPFEQYVGCGLEGNKWSCPLPAGAAEYCSAGQTLTCVPPPSTVIV